MPMPAAAKLTRRQSTPFVPTDGYEQLFFLDNVDWKTYVTITDALAERNIQITYDRGRLEFMSVSGKHERRKSLLGYLVEVLTEEFELPMQGVGSMTCKNERVARGLESDDSWYIESLPKVIDKEDIDLEVDPPPDLAVEIDVSRRSINRLGVYEGLRIPQVWRYDGKTLKVYLLSAEGKYNEFEKSPTFPGIPIAGIVEFLQQGAAADHNAIKKSFRQWVRKQRRKKKK